MTQSAHFQEREYQPCGVEVSVDNIAGSQVLRVVKPEANTKPDDATYARVVGPDFHDGTIEIDVRSRLMPWADVDCRGFIGLTFRCSEANDSFEGFYVRPRNGRACTDPKRRVHTMQYFSYPGYTFSYFRERGISDYEAQADIAMDEWVHLAATIHGDSAEFYVNDPTVPALVVPHLFHGADARGGVGLYVDNGTEGFFRNLQIVSA